MSLNLNHKVVRLRKESGEKTDITPGMAIRVPEDKLCLEFPESSELLSTKLTIGPVGESEKIETCDFSSVEGSIENIESKKSAWIIADFKEERLINKIEIEPGTESKVRISLFNNNSWVLLQPVDTFDLEKKSFNFLEVSASKVMLEFGTKAEETGIWKPSEVSIKEIAFYSAMYPSDLSVTVFENTPFFKREGIYRDTEAVEIQGLKKEINRYLAQTDKLFVPLHFHSKIPAKITIKEFNCELSCLKKGFDQPENWEKIDLCPGDEKELSVNLGSGSKIRGIVFDYRVAFSSECLIFDSELKDPSLSYVCNPSNQTAQCFKSLSKGLDLVLFELFGRITQYPLKAELSIHPDESEFPDKNPLPNATAKIEIHEKKENYWEPDWIRWRFESPISLSKNKWWIVLNIQRGELHWYLDEGTPELVLSQANRTGIDPWGKSGYPNGNNKKFFRSSRLFAKGDTTPGISFSVCRNNEKIPIAHDNSGHVNISGESLDAINQDPATKRKDVRLALSSNAVSQIKMETVRIRYIPKDKQ